MKTMAGRILRYIRLYIILTRINILNQMEYRFGFVTAIIPTSLYMLSYILLVNAIFGKVPNIVGYSFNDMMVIFSSVQIFYLLTWIVYRESLNYFSEDVSTGRFDFVSKLPINTRFIVSFRYQSVNEWLTLLFSFLIFLRSISNVHIELTNWISFWILSLMGFVIMYNIFFILATFSFWITENDELTNLFDELLNFGRYPDSVFPKEIAVSFLTLIPVLTISFVPASALLGRLNFWHAILSLILMIATSIISQHIWKRGLRRYSSSG